MLTLKKKLLPILSLIFVLAAMGWLWLSPAKTSVYADPQDPPHVSLVEFTMFNVFTEDSRNEQQTKGKYVLLLRFSDALSDNLSERSGGIKTVNLVNEYGENILLNDMPLTFYYGAEICYYFEAYMWLYVPNLTSYRTLSVQEFVFKDRTIDSFTLYCNSDEAIPWSTVKTQLPQEASFVRIEWNNLGYDYFNPRDGLLLRFDKNLSHARSEIEGGLTRINLIAQSISENVLLYDADDNATPFSAISGAEINYHSECFLWLYVPNMTEYVKLEIKQDTLFLDSKLNGVVLYSNGNKWQTGDPNASRKLTTGTESVSYDTIEWNNCDFGNKGNKNGILIKFNDNLSKLQNEIDGGIQNVNKVKQSIGEHIKLNNTPLQLNNTPLQNIDGAEICYQSEKFLWIYIPGEYLVLSGTFPCLTIENDTEFLNAILHSLTLWFDGTYWVETMPTAYANNAFSDIPHNNVEDELFKGYVYTVLRFDDDFAPPLKKGSTNTTIDSRPNVAQIGDVGQKITINGRTLNELYMEDNNTRCVLSDSNTLYFLIRKSFLFNAPSNTPALTIASGTRFSGKTIGALELYMVDGKWATEPSDSSDPTDEDAAPYIYYYGADEFLVIADKEGGVSEFLSGLSVYLFDERDGNLTFSTDNVEIPEEARTGDKWNQGEWTIKIVATDSNENTTEKEIFINAIDKDKEYLSIYVNGTFAYRIRYGEKIEKSKDETLARSKDDSLEEGNPTKKDDNTTSCFVFVGWTFNGKFWDFENDIATEDIWLSATFAEYRKLCTITVKDTETGKTDVATVQYGDVLDFSEYQKDGYTVLAKVDDVVVKSVAVNGDLDVELQYVPISENGGLTKSLIILLACWAGTAVLAVAGVVLYKKLGKKAGKK